MESSTTTRQPRTTDQAVLEHLAALPNPRYEAGIFDLEGDRMSLRNWDRDAVIKAIPYLKAQNAKGRHIYLRPAWPHPYSMIDDLSAEKLAALKSDGFNPALVIETSPGNYQAWVAHGRSLDQDLSTAVAQNLARRYEGDQSAADWRRFGRLAGFTNRKAKYRRDDGKFPFVRIVEASGACCARSAELIEEVGRELEAAAVAERERRAHFQHRPTPAGAPELKSIDDFRRSPTYAGDFHRADLAYATYAFAHGLSRHDIEAAIRSRDLTHKGKEARQRDYVQRTLEKAEQAARGHQRNPGVTR